MSIPGRSNNHVHERKFRCSQGKEETTVYTDLRHTWKFADLRSAGEADTGVCIRVFMSSKHQVLLLVKRRWLGSDAQLPTFKNLTTKPTNPKTTTRELCDVGYNSSTVLHQHSFPTGISLSWMWEGRHSPEPFLIDIIRTKKGCLSIRTP